MGNGSCLVISPKYSTPDSERRSTATMLHKHYLLPKELECKFKEAKPHGIPIDPEDFIVEVEMEHLDYRDFISFQAAWLQSWRSFFERNKRPSVNLIFGYCDWMVTAFKLDQKKNDESTT